MTQIKLKIRVNAVDNVTPINDVFIVFNLKNNSNRIEILYENIDPIIEFVIKDSASIKVESSERELLMRIIPISCSLVCHNVVFSTNDYSNFSIIDIYNSKSEIPEDIPPKEVDHVVLEEHDPYKGQNVIRLQSVPSEDYVANVRLFVKEIITFDVSKFLRIFKGLYNVGIFEPKSTILEQNFVESLREYELAMNSNDNYECFKHLFCSLEKIVNIKKEYFGDDFDIEVSKLSSINEHDAKKLRYCYNRMKHSSRNHNHVVDLERCLGKLRLTIKTLKKIVDESIFLRITLFELYLK